MEVNVLDLTDWRIERFYNPDESSPCLECNTEYRVVFNNGDDAKTSKNLLAQSEEKVEIKELQEQLVTPWEVEAKDDGKIDYNKLIKDFGCQKVELEMVARVEKLTGKPAHPFLRRGVFFAHRCGSIITLSMEIDYSCSWHDCTHCRVILELLL